MTNEQKLFTEFTPATKADWEQRAQKDLRDISLNELTLRTYEGIHIRPYFNREDIEHLPLPQQQPGAFPFVRSHKTTTNSWLNLQHFRVRDNGKLAIDKAADALNKGADGVHFTIDNPQHFDLAYLVEHLDLVQYTVCYTVKVNPTTFFERLFTHLQNKKISPPDLKGYINYDPMTDRGELSQKENKAITYLLDLTKDSPGFRGLTVCGTNFSSIGSSITQEVAYTLSAAVAYTDRLTNAGVPLDAVLRNMQFYMGSGTNYFFEIAKLRALRLLWAAVVQAYGAAPELAGQLHIHSTTSSWFQTTLDPHMNMLRATTEAMAAVLAGCDSLTVKPFDSTFRQSDDFSERIARNVSTILKEESYLDKAIDPAAGSYYLESMTQEMADHAWVLFQEVEAKGGFEAAYESGYILGSITEVSRKKFKNIATGREVLVGTNKYPNPKEKVDFDPEELIQSPDFDTTRAAYPTEVMRMATELHLRKRKRRPKALIAVIGSQEKRHVNASFAKEFFSCAGFDTDIQNYTTTEEAADVLIHAAAEVVVVSTSEAAYAREFGPMLREHKSKPTIIMAEDPQQMKDEMIAQGYDEFLFEDCDTSTILELVHRRLQESDRESGNSW